MEIGAGSDAEAGEGSTEMSLARKEGESAGWVQFGLPARTSRGRRADLGQTLKFFYGPSLLQVLFCAV